MDHTLLSIGLSATFAALVFTISVFGSALDEARQLEVDNYFTRSPLLSYFSSFLLGILAWPALLVLMVLPFKWELFVDAVRAVVTEPQEI